MNKTTEHKIFKTFDKFYSAKEYPNKFVLYSPLRKADVNVVFGLGK